MVKLKTTPKNLELDINVAKMGNSAFFLQQLANSATNSKFHGAE